MVAGRHLVVDRAVEAGKTVVERDGAFVGGGQRESVEAVLDRAGELAAGRVVVLGQDRHAEVVGSAQGGPGPRGGGHRKRDQRRVETDGGERACSKADAGAVDGRGQCHHTAREDAEHLAQPARVEVLVGGEAVDGHAVTPVVRVSCAWTSGRALSSQPSYATGWSCSWSSRKRAGAGTHAPSSTSSGRR